MLKTTAYTCTSLLLLTVLLACSSNPKSQPSTFHDPNMDFGLINNVAVMPFADLSGQGGAAERVREVFSTMLQATVEVYVIPPGEVNRGIDRLGITEPTNPTKEEIVNLANNLNADVVILGAVLEYGEVRSSAARANAISLTARLFEGSTGKVVWSSSATRGGVGTSERLLGGGGEPMNIVTTQAVDDLLSSLVGE